MAQSAEDYLAGVNEPGTANVTTTQPAAGLQSHEDYLSGVSAPGEGDGTELRATPPEYTGWDRPLSLLRNATVHSLAGTIGQSLAGTIGNWSPFDVAAPVMPLVRAGAQALGHPLPNALDVQDWAGRHGLLSREQATPQGAEVPLVGAYEGLLSAAPFLAAGPEGLAARAAMAGQAAVGGALGATAQQLAPDNPLGQAALPLIAGALPVAGLEAVMQAGARRDAGRAAGLAATGAQSDADLALQQVEAAKQHLDATQARSTLALRNAREAANAPSVGTLATAARAAADSQTATIDASERLRDAAVDAAQSRAAELHAGADSAVEALAAVHGPEASYETGGATAQTAAQHWLDNEFPKQHDLLWQPVDAAIPAGTTVPLTQYREGLQRLAGRAGAMQPSAEALSPVAAKAQQLLARLPPTPAEARAAYDAQLPGMQAVHETDGTPIPPFEPPAQPTWSDVKQFRTMLGEALGNPTLLRDLPQQRVAELYARLTGDMRGAATEAGPDALTAFDDANHGSRNLFNFVEGPLGKVLAGGPEGSPGARPAGSVAKSLLTAARTDGGTLAALRATVPGVVEPLAAAALREAPGDWDRLSPTAQQALIPDAGHRAVLDQIAPARAAADQHVTSVTAAARDAHAETTAAARATGADLIDTSRLASHNELNTVRATGDTATEGAKLGLATAQQRAKTTAAAVPPAAPTPAPGTAGPRLQHALNHTGQHLVNALVMGYGAHELLPAVNPLVAAGTGVLMSTAVPALGRGLAAPFSAAMRNPGPPALAALGASNALFPQPGAPRPQ